MFYAVREWLLYRTWIGQLLLSLPITWWFLTIQHQRIARYADSEKSKKDIPGLIKVRALGVADRIIWSHISSSYCWFKLCLLLSVSHWLVTA